MRQNDLETLARSAIDPRVSESSFELVCAAEGSDAAMLLEGVAKHIVQGYVDGTWSFSDADAAMNHFWAFLLFRKEYVFPDYFHIVFLAFDAGEFSMKGIPRDVSPEDLYTKPILAKILSNS